LICHSSNLTYQKNLQKRCYTSRKGYDSEGKAVFTLAELERWITIAITDYYHQKYHESIRMSPIEKYKQGILGDEFNRGKGYPPKINNNKAFLIDFLPIERRSLQREGFVLDHITYYSSVLSPLIADRTKYGKIIVRRDPWDLSRIYVLDPLSKNNYLEVFYRTLARPTITLWEHRQAIKDIKKKGYQLINEDLVFKTITKLRDVTKEAAKKTKSARRALERMPKSDKRKELNFNEVASNKNNVIDNPKVPRYKEIEIWRQIR